MILGGIEFVFNKPQNKLFVLNYHGTPKKFIHNFEKQLDFFCQYFNIINPNQLFEYFNGKTLEERNYLLLTFDDGLKNNLYAIDALNKRGISAIFFIVPGFIDSSDQKKYYTKFIRPIINPYIDSEPEDFISLNWEDLNEIKRNHVIGSHSYYHSMLNFDNESDNLGKEILHSADYISEKINKSIDSFCSINNTLLSVNKFSKKMINEKYKYHFTTIAGCNRFPSDNLFIKRINVECFWTLGACKFAIGNLNNSRYKNKIKLYNSL